MKTLKIFFKSICIIFCSFILVGWSLFGDDDVKYPPIPKEISKKTYCAKNGKKFGHTVVIIDTTTALTPESSEARYNCSCHWHLNHIEYGENVSFVFSYIIFCFYHWKNQQCRRRITIVSRFIFVNRSFVRF